MGSLSSPLSSFASASSSAIASVLPASAPVDVLTDSRMGFRSSSAVMGSIPRFFAKMASLGYLGTAADVAYSPAPRATEAITTNASSAAAVSDAFSQGVATASNGTSDAAGAAYEGGVRGIGNVFTYMTSRWAILCLFMTVLLNRTLIYASLRRPIRLPFRIRLLMRIVPVTMLLYHIVHILSAMRCQSSSIFQGERKGVDSSVVGTEGFFHTIGRAGSWWMDDLPVCKAIGMIPGSEWIDQASSLADTENPEIEIAAPRGSLEILWPLYKTLSLSQFVEVFTCSLIGRMPAAETGMTLLEHSLAFAEAEALSIRKTYRLETVQGESEENTEPRIFKIKGERLVPVEVLYISLISAMSHVTSHVMAIFNRQARYRLITTGIYGIAFLGGFALALLREGTLGILDFPTVSVVGFIPHLLIFAAITICAGIYGLALLLASLFPVSGRRGFSEGFNNLRANLTLSTVNVSLSEDFYTVLLKLGFMCLSAASEATYLNEGRAVRIPGWTWLEGERVKMLDAQRTFVGAEKSGQFKHTGKGAGPYSNERKDFRGIVENAKDKRRAGGKWIGAGEMLRGASVVLGRWGLVGASKLFGRNARTDETLLPAAVDPAEEQLLEEAESDEDRFYRRFLADTPLSDIDTSPDYAPPKSSSTYSSEDSESESSDEAVSVDSSYRQRYHSDTDITPTKFKPHSHHNSRNWAHRFLSPEVEESTSVTELFETPARLASLLDPQSPEDRASARLLARHLTSSRPLTRGQYTSQNSSNLSGIAEESALENILLTRRRETVPRPPSSPSHVVEEEKPSGPVCVVCQSAQRTIIVWPCRCLSLCEDCRVCLAMNNWSNCVTCRVPSIGYSRIYVP